MNKHPKNGCLEGECDWCVRLRVRLSSMEKDFINVGDQVSKANALIKKIKNWPEPHSGWYCVNCGPIMPKDVTYEENCALCGEELR